MTTKILRRARSLRADRRGVTVVEFAMLLPGMLTLIFGAIETGHVLGIRSNLEGAIQQAAREASAQLDLTEDERQELLETTLRDKMSPIAPAENQVIRISTEVYSDFNNSYAEAFEDVNKDGQYTPAGPDRPAEPFVDRNANTRWDPAVPIGGRFGGPGDVVSYTAIFPAPLYFSYFFGDPDVFSMDIKATALARNEPEARLS